jgi:hypothetical protein
MKTRIAIAALLVASLLGFGFVRAVSAASVCPSIDLESDKEVHQCSSSYVVDAAVPMGGFLWVTPVKDYANLPNVPNTDFLGPAVTLTVVDWNGVAQSSAHLEVCLADSSSTGNVFMWSGSGSIYSSKNTGSWWALPTYHLPGWDCASSAMPGTFSIN